MICERCKQERDVDDFPERNGRHSFIMCKECLSKLPKGKRKKKTKLRDNSKAIIDDDYPTNYTVYRRIKLVKLEDYRRTILSQIKELEEIV